MNSLTDHEQFNIFKYVEREVKTKMAERNLGINLLFYTSCPIFKQQANRNDGLTLTTKKNAYVEINS